MMNTWRTVRGSAPGWMTADWLFFYYMPGYAGAGERFLWVVLPSALMTAPGSWLLHRAVQRISTEFKIDNGVV